MAISGGAEVRPRKLSQVDHDPENPRPCRPERGERSAFYVFNKKQQMPLSLGRIGMTVSLFQQRASLE